MDKKFESISPFILDGLIAADLYFGGSYVRFERSAASAKRLGINFADALFDQRYDDIFIAHSSDYLGKWFNASGLDSSWIIVDRQNSMVWALFLTDAD
jgi:hypothetical protein